MTPAAIIQPAPAPGIEPSVSASLPVAAATVRKGRSWAALGDQILVSGANFVTMVMTARALGRDEFGLFTQAYAILLLANLFQSALIIQAHNVQGQTVSGERYVDFTTTTGLAQLGLCGIQALIISAVAAISAANGASWAALAWSLGPAVCAWQAQEFVRRVLYTESRHIAALVNDCISYGGQGVLIYWLWHTHALTDIRAMYALTWTSLAGAVLGIWQIRTSLAGRFDRQTITANWQFGRWLLGGELLQYACSIQTYLFIAAYLLGASAAGELRAAQIVYGPTRVFSFYLGNVLPIRFARALATEGDRAARASFSAVLRQVVPPFAAYALLVAIFARPILRLLYGPDFAGDALVLQVYSLVAVLSYAQMIFVSLLTAQRRTRVIFVGQLAGAVLGLAIGWGAILLIGIAGAPLAIGVSTLATMMYLNSKIRDGSNSSATATAELSSGSGLATTTVPAVEVANTPAALDLRTRRSQLLLAALRGLDHAGIRYVITHGHASLPTDIGNDVDCVINSGISRDTLTRALTGAADGLRIVQWLSDGADYIVVADGDLRSPAMVALHLSTEYDIGGYRVFKGPELLDARIRRDDLWVTPPAVEAACIVANRTMKMDLRAKDQARLTTLFAADRAGCMTQTARVLGDANAAAIARATSSNDWAAITSGMDRLASTLKKKIGAGDRMAVLRRRTKDALRRLARWTRPKNGFHVVFLGPDGVGKSTVIEQVQEAVRPAFLNYSYQTFAPSLLPAKFTMKPSPHAKPPRSYPASLMKAAWWSFCYGPLYFYAVHPTRSRAGLVVNHRYLLDAIVDKKRYRYSGPTWLLKAIWAISPKPDLVILLEAPAEVIQKRKQEMTFEETARQCGAYRGLIDTLTNGVRVDASRPLDETVAAANEAILSRMQERFAPPVAAE